MTLRKILAYTVAIIVGIVLCFYVYHQAKTYLKGPQLVITSPSSGTSTDKALVNIQGKAQNISFLSMNGEQIFVDEQGIFNEKLLLVPGYNIIEVKATDRFGRTISRVTQITKTGDDTESSPLFIIDEKNSTTTTKQVD